MKPRFAFTAPVIHKNGKVSQITGDGLGATEMEAREMFVRNLGKMGWSVTGEICRQEIHYQEVAPCSG